MNLLPLTADDVDLIAAAREAASHIYHTLEGAKPAFVAAAVRTKSGKIYTAGNMICDVANVGICAEPIALAQANKNPHDPVTTIVAVYNDSVKSGEHAYDPAHIQVVPPCGRCREVLTDFAPDAYVLLRKPGGEEFFKIPCRDLLPFKFSDYKKFS